MGKTYSISKGKEHSFFYSMLRPHSHRRQAIYYRALITIVILLDVAAFVMQTERQIEQEYHTFFSWLEGVSSCIFLAEYCLRMYTITESSAYKDYDPFAARVCFLVSVSSILDLLVTLPWFIEVIAGQACNMSMRNCSVSLPNLQFLRLFRLARLLKAAPVVGAFEVIQRVIYFNAEILAVALLICAVLILVTSTVLYYLRPPGDSVNNFNSIPNTMFLSVMMLTGQGQPEGELPWYTKLIVCVTSIFAVAQFAIPASMLTWGFEAEAQRRIVKHHEELKKQKAREKAGQATPLSSSSSEGGNDSEWEEYEAIVVAEPSSSSDDETLSAAEQEVHI